MSVENLFSRPLKVVNVGLQSFAQDLRSLGVQCRQVTLEAPPPTGSAPATSEED